MSDYVGSAVIRKDGRAFDATVKLWRKPGADGLSSWGGEITISGHPDPAMLSGGEFAIEIPDAGHGRILVETNVGWQRGVGTRYVVSGSGDPPFGDAAAP